MKNTDEKENLPENTFGFLLEDNGKRVAYLSDFYKIPGKTLRLIKNTGILITDGTYLFENVIPKNSGYSYLKKDPDHLHGKEVLRFIETVNPKLTIIHSIPHIVEKSHEELQKMLPRNIKLAYDGMMI